MSDRLYEKIIFAIDDYNNETAMWSNIGKQLQILMKNGYVAKIHALDNLDDIISIQFQHNDPELTESICDWLTWDEYDNIINVREQDN